MQVKGQKAGSFFGEPPNGGGGERGIVQQSKENNKVLCENQKSRVTYLLGWHSLEIHRKFEHLLISSAARKMRHILNCNDCMVSSIAPLRKTFQYELNIDTRYDCGTGCRLLAIGKADRFITSPQCGLAKNGDVDHQGKNMTTLLIDLNFFIQ